MAERRAIFTVISGPNQGDTLRLEQGTCRLIGRHLSESETTLLDHDGNRLLGGAAAQLIAKHLKTHTPEEEAQPPAPPAATAALGTGAFERGPDIVFSDDSISRAHAMIFCDSSAAGIIDLASTNGTFVNTERVSSAIVNDGDAITIGSSELTVQLR